MSSQRKQESLRKFNEAASTYDSKSSDWTRRTHPFILAELKLEPVTSVLDVGCGTGTLLSSFDSGVRTAGLDFSPEMMSKAREKLGADADLRVGDSERLPWSNEAFDAVTINLSFHHYEHPVTVLREVRRVLKNRGRVIIGDMCPTSLLNRLVNFFTRFGHGGDVHLYSESEMRRLLEEAEFRDISWKRTTRFTMIVSARAIKETGA